jgi:hypothetical protein
MQQDLLEPELIAPQRPLFLKVLCILTFIGSGYGIINSAFTYFKANDIAIIMIETKDKMSKDQKKERDPESKSIVANVTNNLTEMSNPANLQKAAIGTFITSILCLLGAFLMWKLRRPGFYIYTLGTILSIIIPFYMFGSNLITNLSGGFMGFIGILFVIFYAMNLKSMK